MDKKALQLLGTYWEEIQYVGDEPKTIEEMSTFIRGRDFSTSTCERHVDAVKNGEIPWLTIADDIVSLNEAMFTNLYGDLGCVLKTSIENEIHSLKRMNEHLFQALREKVGSPILLVDSEVVGPDLDDEERMLLDMHPNVKEVPQPQKDNILTRRNYVRRGIKKILTNTFLEDKVKYLLYKHGKKKFMSNKELVKGLLEMDNLTNQEKLGVYAAFSEYRYTDMEQLLNFAGDNNIDANLVIKWAESVGDKVDFLQIKILYASLQNHLNI